MPERMFSWDDTLFFTAFVTADGEFAQIIPAEIIAEWFEEHPDAAELPEEVKALKEITAEDNPVVVLMK